LIIKTSGDNLARRRGRRYSKKGFTGGGFDKLLGPITLIVVFGIYFLSALLNWLKNMVHKITLWDVKDWLICILIVGGLTSLYILADRQTKRRYFTEQPVRPFTLKKGRSIYEITAGLAPTQFEVFVADLYRHSGYHTEVTSQTNDHGKDVILTKNKEITYVECKLYAKGNNIGRPDLQKLHGAMSKDKVERGIFVTTSNFAKTAVVYARGTGIELVDGDDLISLIGKVRPDLLYKDYVMETPETEPI